jgi:hypothetical protein
LLGDDCAALTPEGATGASGATDEAKKNFENKQPRFLKIFFAPSRMD